jgi:hypothetical protein
MSFWIKKNGRADSMLTIAVYASAIVLLKFLISGIEFQGIKFESLDAGVVGAILTPTLGAYVARKWGRKEENVKPQE